METWYLDALIICAIVVVWEIIERLVIKKSGKKSKAELKREEIIEFEREFEYDIIIKRMYPGINTESTIEDLRIFLKTYPNFILRMWYRQDGKKYHVVRYNREEVFEFLRDEEDKNWDKELYKNAVVEYENDDEN